MGWAQEICAVIGHKRARQSSGTGLCGNCRGVVGIVVPFVPRGYSGKIRFIVPQGINAAGRHRRAKQSSGTGPCGDCRRVLCIPGLWGQYSGENRFIEKPGVQNYGVDMWLHVVLTPG